MADSTGSLVISPTSISIAMSMLGAGALGATRAEIAKATHLDLAATDFHDRMRDHLAWLSHQKQDDIELSFANGIWTSVGCVPDSRTRALLARCYDATIENADFRASPEAAATRMNEFVDSHTHGRITSIMSPQTLGKLTGVVMIDAVFFNGLWQQPFSEAATKPEEFFASVAKPVFVPMMHAVIETDYLENGQAQVLQLRYRGARLAMMIVLPKVGLPLAALEAQLTPQILSQWRDGLVEQEVNLALPRFSASSELDLVPVLRHLGVERVFSPVLAQLPGLCSASGLFVSRIVHYATIEVAERGTVAAAASVNETMMGVHAINKLPAEFRADRPFLFLIADTVTGAVSFMGRYCGPEGP